MRKVILYMITTLDGLIAGPDDSLAHYEPSDEEHRFANDLFGRAGALLFGRVAYEGFVSYWDTLDLTDAANPRVAVDFATTKALFELGDAVAHATLTLARTRSGFFEDGSLRAQARTQVTADRFEFHGAQAVR